MYRVIRRRGISQQLFGFLCVLAIATTAGCRPSESKPQPEPEKPNAVQSPPADEKVAPPPSAVENKSEPAATEAATPEKKPEKPAAEPTEKPAAPPAATDPTLDVSLAHMPDPVENPASVAATEKQMKPYAERITSTDVTFDMVPIPGGVFKMGSPDDEKGRRKDEGPQVEVKLEPFWMGKCEVTWNEFELWAAGLDKQRREAKKDNKPTVWDTTADALAIPTPPYSDMTFGMGKEGYPAICMTQFAAKMYCKWLTAKTGRYYRLPTEAEWEYAARAGKDTAYSFGKDSEQLEDYGWFADNSEEQYHKVGEKKPNPWGLHDMHGNVCELCLDEYVPDRYAQLKGNPVESPLLIVTKTYPQVARGGAWTDEAELLRSAARRPSNPQWKEQDPQIPQSIWYFTDADFVGFRVVRPLRTPTPEEAARYEVTDFEKQEYLDYQEAQAGKQ